MKIYLRTSNKNKVKENKRIFSTGYDGVPRSARCWKSFEIDECGTSFKQNALIKVRAVYEALKSKKFAERIFRAKR